LRELIKLEPDANKLLVIDDVKEIKENQEKLEKILGLEHNGYRVLLTSRFRVKNIEIYPLPSLDPLDAQKLFFDNYTTEELEKVKQITEYLDYHPLFVELVVKTIKNVGYSLDEIIEKFELGELAKIEFIDEEDGDEVSFNQNLQKLFEMQKKSLKDEYLLLLKQLSVLPSIDIELSFLEKIFDKKLQSRLNFLVAQGWLIESVDGYKLHQVVKEFLLVNYPPSFEEIEIIFDSLLRLLINNNEDIKIAFDNKSNLVFFDTLGKFLKKNKMKNIKIGSFFSNLGIIYYLLGVYEKVENYSLKGLSICEEILGTNHPETASSYNNLALFYKLMGEYKKAEPFFLKSLKICKEVLGENHPDTATSYNSLALFYRSKKMYSMAEPLYLKSLKIREKILGEKHPNTISSYNNLAGLYASIGAYEKAEPLFLKSVKISEEILGKNHPDTATSYDNLSLVYIRMGINEKAEYFSLKALKIRLEKLGENHMSTATSYNNVALFYYGMRDFKNAYICMSKAITISKRILPEGDPYLLSSKEGLEMIEEELNK